jgi:Fe2+ or Zn2+ uptake regulation protein
VKNLGEKRPMTKCNRCGCADPPIDAHGHLMCAVCKQIPEFGDCCQGVEAKIEEKEDAEDQNDKA